MRLVTYRLGQDGARVGVERDGLIIDVEHFGEVYGLPLPSTMLELIEIAGSNLLIPVCIFFAFAHSHSQSIHHGEVIE